MNSPKQSARGLLPWLWFGIAALVIAVDQWTKVLALTHLSYNMPEALTSWFNLTLRYNYGVAFSLFDNIEGAQRWPLSILAFLVSCGLIYWIAAKGRQFSLEFAGLSLILGGAIGNLYDRITLGYVVDFIEWHYQGYYWPAFNIADSAICVGAALLLYDSFFSTSARKKA